LLYKSKSRSFLRTTITQRQCNACGTQPDIQIEVKVEEIHF